MLGKRLALFCLPTDWDTFMPCSAPASSPLHEVHPRTPLSMNHTLLKLLSLDRYIYSCCEVTVKHFFLRLLGGFQSFPGPTDSSNLRLYIAGKWRLLCPVHILPSQDSKVTRGDLWHLCCEVRPKVTLLMTTANNKCAVIRIIYQAPCGAFNPITPKAGAGASL